MEDFEDVNDAVEKNTESLKTQSSRISSSSSGVESMVDGDAGVALGEEEGEVPDISVTNAEEDKDVPANSENTENDNSQLNDIDSPFEVFNTVYVQYYHFIYRQKFGNHILL